MENTPSFLTGTLSERLVRNRSAVVRASVVVVDCKDNQAEMRFLESGFEVLGAAGLVTRHAPGEEREALVSLIATALQCNREFAIRHLDRLLGDMKCRICERTLNEPNNPLSLDCGGDCWGCVGEAEAGKQP